LDLTVFQTNDSKKMMANSSSVLMGMRMTAAHSLSMQLQGSAVGVELNSDPYQHEIASERTIDLGRDTSRAASNFRWRRLMRGIPDEYQAHLGQLDHEGRRDDVFEIAALVRGSAEDALNKARNRAIKLGFEEPQRLVHALNASKNAPELGGAGTFLA
jgi:hypothetical protein